MNNKRIDILCTFVSDQIEKEPYSLDGFEWCAMRRANLAEQVGMSVSTLGRLISNPPFVRQQKQIDGVKQVLIRVGKPGPITNRHVANTMSKVWREHIAAMHEGWRVEIASTRNGLHDLSGSEKTVAEKRIAKLEKLLLRKPVTYRPEYGCMNGLAEYWPDGHQVELFKMVLKRWSEFMAGAEWDMPRLEDEYVKTEKRFFEFPSVSVLRRFAPVALEMAEMDAQDALATKGTAPPEWIKALNPKLWPKSN